MKNALNGPIRDASLVTLSLFAWNFGMLPAEANPTGGTVAQGSATFNASGSQFTINQASANAYINWQSFNIGAGQTTTFVQPSSTSVAWNHINDSNPSQILGTLDANGYVILQNPNGFYVGGNAAISAHGLVLTTSPTPAPTLSSGGAWDFNTPPVGADIINYGKINISGGGSAYLIADNIQNYGAIQAEQGKIGLYAGQQVLLSTSPDGHGISAKVTLPQGSVDNQGHLIADGGTIAAMAQTVNQNGLVQANSIQNVNGVVELVASDSLNLGANSVISAQGAATGVSSGGSVTIQSDNTFSDQAGSTINIAGGAQGGNGGHAEISAPQMNSLHSAILGQAATGFLGGKLVIDPADLWLASSATDPSAPAGYTVIDVNSYSGLSAISLSADDNITVNTLWTLANASAPLALSLSAGNSIIFNDGSGISAGNNWSVNLTAGTAFVPTAAQPKPSPGNASIGDYEYGIYLNGSAFVQTQNGNINLWAANELQIATTGFDVAGSSGIRTTKGGSIAVTAEFGDVNTGGNPNGYDYQATAPFFTVDPGLGGISTAAGGNVSIDAGGNVYSYVPSGTAASDGGTGAFGTEAGNVTITAAGSIYGHYVLANGVGSITAGQDVGAANGNPFALSLIDGTWSVNAPNGNIFLQEVRNPNGDFNNMQGRKSQSPGKFLFDYAADAAVNLTAGDGVYLTGTDGSYPRLPNADIPVLYPPILDITAGAGGVTLEGNVTLFPSPYQNLTITTTDGGNLTAPASLETPIELYMSDSAQTQWKSTTTFSDEDHGSTLTELNNPNPVFIDISGSMENLNLITARETQITVGGDMINCGFSGQNLHSSDITSITVAGQIYNQSAYAFVAVPTISGVPITDLPAGTASSWDDVFFLALNPAAVASLQVPVYITPAQWLNYVLQNAALFPHTIQNGQLIGVDPGFVYNPTTGQLGFGGPMTQSVESALLQPITVLKIGANGLPVTYTGADGNTYFATTTVNWVPPSAIAALYAASQEDPSASFGQTGYRIGGPGQFNVTADSISLGNSFGILSCGVVDPQGGFDRYGNLASVTPSGATVNVTVTADQAGTVATDDTLPDGSLLTIAPHASLDMLTSTIAAIGGGDVNVTSLGGSMDLGSQELYNQSREVGFGLFTTGGGNVNVIAQNDINIDGSRIATYNGGNIFVESLAANIDVGSGGDTATGASVSYVDPSTGLAELYREELYGSGIDATTLVPPQGGLALPPNPAKAPGNITVETPQGNITATLGGITQESEGAVTPIGPTITLEAGTAASSTSPGYVGNIDLGQTGVIGGSVDATANGNITGLIISRQNSTVQAAQNFSGSVLAGGTASVSGGGTVSGVIVGVGGVNVSGTISGAEVLGQNVSVNGGAGTSTLGTTASATAASGSAAQTASDQTKQEVAGNAGNDDDQKKKKLQASVRVKRVTVILPQKS